MNWVNRANAALILLLPTFLAGCLPIPALPTGDKPGTRQNISDSVPAFIVAGSTNKAEVILRLGAPDHRGRDDICFVYVRESAEGGVAFLYGGGLRGGLTGIPVTFKILSIRFSGEGIVESANFRTIVQRDFGPHITLDPPIFSDCPK